MGGVGLPGIDSVLRGGCAVGSERGGLERRFGLGALRGCGVASGGLFAVEGGL